MGTFSIEHIINLAYIWLFLVPVIPTILLVLIKPSRFNRFGPKPKPLNTQERLFTGFINFFNFKSRASRGELFLFMCLSSAMLRVILNLIGIDSLPRLDVFWLVLVIPSLSAIIRRLHDINRSGWWALLIIFGPLSLIFLLMQPSQKTSIDLNSVIES